MNKDAKTKIYLRRSQKYEPIIEQVEQIALQRHGRQLTATIMDILKLGLKSYDSGLRVVDDKLLNINTNNLAMNVRREVGRSVFQGLAGVLVDLKRYEVSKSIPSQEKINFYQLAAKALTSQHAKFRHLTNEDVEDVFKDISPILKACNLAKTKAEIEKIVKLNRKFLLDLINEAGVIL